MKKRTLLLFSLSMVCQISFTQVLTEEEKQELQQECFGNIDFWEGMQYDKQGEFNKARQYYAKAVNTFEENENWLGLIRAGGELVESYGGNNNYQEGLDKAEQLIKIITDNAPQYKAECYFIYYGMSSIYLGADKPVLALATSLKALELLQEKFEEDSDITFVDAYSYIGISHRYLGDIEDALYYLERAYDVLLRQEEDHPVQNAVTLFFISGIELMRGNNSRAIDLLEKTVVYAKKGYGENNIRLWNFYGLLGKAYTKLSEFEKAIEYGKKSIHLIESHDDLPDIYYYSFLPSIYFNISTNYMALEQLEQAKYYYEQGLIYEENDDDDVNDNPLVMSYDATIKLREGRVKESLTLYQRSDSMYTVMKEADTTMHKAYNDYLVKSKYKIAQAYQALDQIDSALVYLHQSVDIAQLLYDKEQASWKTLTYSELAGLYIELEEIDSALFYNQQALSTECDRADLIDYYELPEVNTFRNTSEAYPILLQKSELLQKIASQAADQKEYKIGLDRALGFIDLSDRLHLQNLKKINLLHGAQSKTLVSLSIDNYRKGLELAEEVYQLDSDTLFLHKGFYYAQKMKAQQLWLSLLNSRAKNFASLDRELLEKERDLLSAITYYEQKIKEAKQAKDSTTVIKYENEYLFKYKEDYAMFQRTLENQYPEYYESKYDFIPENEASLQAVLKEGELLVEYVLTDSFLYAFTLSHNEAIQLTKIPILEDLEVIISKLSESLQNSTMQRKSSRAKFIQGSHQLYRQFIQPIANQLTTKSRLIIIGDAITNYIPFEVLLSSDDFKAFSELDYLIKTYEISYHYSSTLFAKARKAEVPPHNNLYAFAPVYDDHTVETHMMNDASATYPSLRALTDEGIFIPLPESEKETKAIVGLFRAASTSNTKLALREQAREALFKTELEQEYRYIHIAGHSFADLENPDFSGIACFQDTISQGEDGILYTAEIYNINTSADLVTLSSCESGYGKLEGTEGLLGLNRAFIYAGAQNVIFSLWKVYDKVSAQMMIDFYEDVLKQDADYTSSLRNAKLQCIKNPATASPHFWSAYLLIGR